MELSELRDRLADYLKGHGLNAMPSYGEQRRLRGGGAVAVSLRRLEDGEAGFWNYLGERFDEADGQWEELYGKRAALTMGLELHAPTMAELHRCLEKLLGALQQGSPDGFGTAELTVEEPFYSGEQREYLCAVQARYTVWFKAVQREEDSFLNFEVRGEHTI